MNLNLTDRSAGCEVCQPSFAHQPGAFSFCRTVFLRHWKILPRSACASAELPV